MSTFKKLLRPQTLIDASVTGDTVSSAINPSEADDVILQVVSNGTGSMQVYGSIAEDQPDFSAPSSVTNPYYKIALFDLETKADITDGFDMTGSMSKGLSVENTHARWLAVKVTGVTGTLVLKVDATFTIVS